MIDLEQQLPKPSSRHIAMHVKPAAERALRRGHPWLFDQSIRKQSHQGKPGDLAIVFDRKNRFLAVGLYDPISPIRVRVLHQGEPTPIDSSWFQGRLAEAANKRSPLGNTGTNAYRMVHGENDYLPGLIVDRYDTSYVLKIYSSSWIPHLPKLLPAISSVSSSSRILLRLSRHLRKDQDKLHGLEDGQVLVGLPLEGPATFCENDINFEADLVRGQKTGFFLDQRENRARVQSLVAGDKSIKRVLNLYAYTGAFSLYAAKGGATEVISVDASEPALAFASRNFLLNQHNGNVAATAHQTANGDALEVTEKIRVSGRQIDLVIADPPSFAKSESEVQGALRAYNRLARAALSVLRPGGHLVLSSCSSHIPAELFFQCVVETAQSEGRPLQEVEQTGHPLDHPIGFPQGAYLKCLFARAP
jgi:23S rRNA (cytosine1962-C5)-methyltransferase